MCEQCNNDGQGYFVVPSSYGFVSMCLCAKCADKETNLNGFFEEMEAAMNHAEWLTEREG